MRVFQPPCTATALRHAAHADESEWRRPQIRWFANFILAELMVQADCILRVTLVQVSVIASTAPTAVSAAL
jgi:hypothetical protein